MRPPSCKVGFRHNQPDWSQLSAWLVTVTCVVVAPGCEEETRNLGKRPETRALDQTGVSVGLDDDSPRMRWRGRRQSNRARSLASALQTFALRLKKSNRGAHNPLPPELSPETRSRSGERICINCGPGGN